MKIFTKSYLLLITLMLSFFSGMSTAADIESSYQVNIIDSISAGTHIINDHRIQQLAEQMTPFIRSLSDNLDKNKSSLNSAGSAPPLTYLEVYAAISSQHPSYEYFSQIQGSSVYDHGGTAMYIVTVEIGYGTNQIAQMNAGNLTQLQSQAITNSSGTIVGWYRWWVASGYQNGFFTYQATSINSPWNTMSDSISIK